MAKVNIVLNKSGVRELLKSSEMQQICMEHATDAASACGTGYEAQERNYPERKGAAVVAVTHAAKRDNLKNNTILKSLR